MPVHQQACRRGSRCAQADPQSRGGGSKEHVAGHRELGVSLTRNRSQRSRVLLLAACGLAALLSSARAEQQSFDAWLQDFRSEALAARISAATLDAALAGLTPLEAVIERDRQQPEFTLDFRSYLARVASQSRIEEGQRMLAEHGQLVRAVASRYGMPPSLLVAVWGIESNYGRTQGEFSVVQARATLAYDGRRGAMFRRELLNALR